MPFEKLSAVEGSIACLTCGCGARSDLKMDRMIAVGFGSAGYSKDGVSLWSEDEVDKDDESALYPEVKDVEAMATADPDHDWRIYFYAPLYSAEYQRQGDGVWVLIKKDLGFA